MRCFPSTVPRTHSLPNQPGSIRESHGLGTANFRVPVSVYLYARWLSCPHIRHFMSAQLPLLFNSDEEGLGGTFMAMGFTVRSFSGLSLSFDRWYNALHISILSRVAAQIKTLDSINSRTLFRWGVCPLDLRSPSGVSRTSELTFMHHSSRAVLMLNFFFMAAAKRYILRLSSVAR